MSNYKPGGKKKLKIFLKRETELIHAIKHKYSQEKIERAVEALRDAKLQSIWAYKGNSDVPRKQKLKLANKWSSYTNTEIIEKYSRKK